MTADEEIEHTLLALMTPDTKKLAIEYGYQFDDRAQLALERLQLRDWIRLIDISPVHAAPGRVMRVFRVMPEAVAWFERN